MTFECFRWEDPAKEDDFVCKIADKVILESHFVCKTCIQNHFKAKKNKNKHKLTSPNFTLKNIPYENPRVLGKVLLEGGCT